MSFLWAKAALLIISNQKQPAGAARAQFWLSVRKFVQSFAFGQVSAAFFGARPLHSAPQAPSEQIVGFLGKNSFKIQHHSQVVILRQPSAGAASGFFLTAVRRRKRLPG